MCMIFATKTCDNRAGFRCFEVMTAFGTSSKFSNVAVFWLFVGRDRVR